MVEDEEARALREDRVDRAVSVDGGRALAALVGLTGLPEWEEDAEEADGAPQGGEDAGTGGGSDVGQNGTGNDAAERRGPQLRGVVQHDRRS